MSEANHEPATCPCRVLEKSTEPFSDCCQPYLLNVKQPPSAEALMRSRYSAYVTGDIAYLINSWWPDQQSQLDRDSITRWSQQSQWRGLQIHSCQLGLSYDLEGRVEFSAFWLDTDQPGQLQQHRENSYFKRDNGRWYFVENMNEDDITALAMTETPPNLSRNAPCYCGSGKKYKRCCLNTR